ncbi:MAG: rod shape-determining protein MreC [Bacteroidales bacterium]|jgi:rod shape-determining protein MreC|nr:rod shape-determining protein MreC [Bacteroidales bacterium]MDD4703547.1 rod shape-determining protein MreC [Bacteroidales bacterium]MDX9799291.1 rod shape-determining protein MreC [Bacteroidales bacterium]
MRNLVRFLKRYSHIFLFIFLEGIAIYIISQNSFYQASAITSFANQIAGKVNARTYNITKYFTYGSSNEALVKENAKLRAMIETSYVKYQHKAFQYNDTIYKQQFEYIDAKVIQKTISKRNNYFMLNKGRLHGVTNNMGVISPSGIVGVIVNVSDNFSLVMSVLHQDSRPNIKNQRTKISGTLVWEGGDYTSGKLVDIPSSIPLKIGDTIITSGFSQDFPEGIMVGKIKKFDKDKGTGFYVVDIKFAVDYNKLEYVYIVKNFFKEEQIQLTKDIKNE